MGLTTPSLHNIPFICNGIQIHITSNLNSALSAIIEFHQLGTVLSKAPLWVDALCIHKADLDERNAQVGIMARIYSCASLVVSWLGLAEEHSTAAVPIIPYWLEVFELRASALGLGFTGFEDVPSAQVRGLSHLLARRYFYRSWILQEVLLSQDLCLLCGSEVLLLPQLATIERYISQVRKTSGHTDFA